MQNEPGWARPPFPGNRLGSFYQIFRRVHLQTRPRGAKSIVCPQWHMLTVPGTPSPLGRTVASRPVQGLVVTGKRRMQGSTAGVLPHRLLSCRLSGLGASLGSYRCRWGGEGAVESPCQARQVSRESQQMTLTDKRTHRNRTSPAQGHGL